MDDQMHATPTADMELEQRLDAYARARLSLAPETAARIRERVMREARQSLGGSPSAPSRALVPAQTHSLAGARTRARLRRSGALLLAAGLAIGLLGGTAAAAQPGGPLYDARVWAEEVTLPGDPGERAVAELRRLEARLAEIQAAARAGDRGALAAAIAAYGRIEDQALEEAGTDASMLDRLWAALDRHLTVLQGVAATAPSQAREAIERNIDRAVEHNGTTLDRIVSRTPAPNANQGGDTGTGQGGGANTQPAHSPRPAATPTPDGTKKPHPTTKPAVVPDPTPAARTPAPTPVPEDHHSGAKPSPKGPGQGGAGTSQP
jgi:hypothetical protein